VPPVVDEAPFEVDPEQLQATGKQRIPKLRYNRCVIRTYRREYSPDGANATASSHHIHSFWLNFEVLETFRISFQILPCAMAPSSRTTPCKA